MGPTALWAALDQEPDALGNIVSTVEGTEPAAPPFHLFSISVGGPTLPNPWEEAGEEAEHLEISQKPLVCVQIDLTPLKTDTSVTPGGWCRSQPAQSSHVSG